MIIPGRVRIERLLSGHNAQWNTWTPTITSFTGTITSLTIDVARYRKLGNIAELMLRFTITNNGTGATSIVFTTPSDATNLRGTQLFGNNSLGEMLVAQGAASSFGIITYASLYPGATGRIISIKGYYRIAG